MRLNFFRALRDCFHSIELQLIYHLDKSLREIKEKCELYHPQCTPLLSNRQLPTKLTTYKSILTSIYFPVQQVSDTDEKLYCNKIHDKITGRMLKLYDDSINNLQQPFSKNVFNRRIFSKYFQNFKSDVVPILQKITSKFEQTLCLSPSLQFAVQYLDELFTM